MNIFIFRISRNFNELCCLARDFDRKDRRTHSKLSHSWDTTRRKCWKICFSHHDSRVVCLWGAWTCGMNVKTTKISFFYTLFITSEPPKVERASKCEVFAREEFFPGNEILIYKRAEAKNHHKRKTGGMSDSQYNLIMLISDLVANLKL